VTEVPLPPGHRREIWRHRPTGEEFAVQVNAATGRVQHAHGPVNGPMDFGGGKFGIMTGIELPPWLDERRADCDVLTYDEQRGVVKAVDDTEATVTMDDGSERTLAVPERVRDRVETGTRVAIVQVGDTPPILWPDPRFASRGP
jgi:hypothetical protein